MSTKYVRVYYVSGTNTVRHVACKDSPFVGGEGIAEDDVDLDRADYEMSDAPDIISAEEVIKCVEVRGNKPVIDIDKAEQNMRNVKSRGYRPALVSKDGDARTQLPSSARGRAVGRG